MMKKLGNNMRWKVMVFVLFMATFQFPLSVKRAELGHPSRTAGLPTGRLESFLLYPIPPLQPPRPKLPSILEH